MRTANIGGRMSIVTSAGHVDVEAASGGRFGPSPARVFAVWDEFVEWAGEADLPSSTSPDPASLGAPSPEPAQVFAIGLNYRDHATEVSTAVPSEPATFTKFRSSLAGPYGRLSLPAGQVDWEVELVVVIGRHTSHIPAERAWAHIAGLTVGQDYSERVLQLAGATPQYSLGKSFPGFGPMGPELVTPDELENPDDLSISCSINGELVQSSRTSAMVFSVPELVARISAVCPLYPGDVLFTGTPDGVGAARRPPRFLQDGDEVVSRIEGIGEIIQNCYALESSHNPSPPPSDRTRADEKVSE